MVKALWYSAAVFTTLRVWVAPLVVAMGSLGASCGYYDPPPAVTIKDAKDAVLKNPKAPITLEFSEPIKPESLSFSITEFVHDDEWRLPDEQPNKGKNHDYFTYRNGKMTGGKAVLASDNRSITITYAEPPAIGQRLVVIVEPGLADTDSNKTEVRRKLLFGYEFSDNGEGTKIFKTGYYLFLIEVTKPIPVQLRVFGDIRVDSASGKYVSQFTKAERNKDMTRPGCAALNCDPEKDACRLIPEPSCVTPSEKAASPDEFPDFIPNPDPPVGYSFYVEGSLSDQGTDAVAITNTPVDVKVISPPVTIKDLTLNGLFTIDAKGVLRGTGSFTASDVLLGVNSSGSGEGTLNARIIPDGEEPDDIPAPPDK